MQGVRQASVADYMRVFAYPDADQPCNGRVLVSVSISKAGINSGIAIRCVRFAGLDLRMDFQHPVVDQTDNAKCCRGKQKQGE